MGHFHSVDGTTANYSPLQGWSNNKNYAFFAFYPHDLTLVNRDGSTPYSGGVPAVKYTMDAPEEYPEEGPADGATLKASMLDLMTASPHNDLYWKSSSDNSFLKDEDETNDTKGALGEINFSFSHRLACLAVSLEKSSVSDIKITSLALTISGIRNRSTIIPLDETTPTPDENEIFKTCFVMNLESDESTIGQTSKVINDKLIFVPQSEPVSITITVNYTRKYPESEVYADETTITGVTTDLAEGIKQILRLNFVDYNVNVTVIKKNWENKVIDYDFN